MRSREIEEKTIQILPIYLELSTVCSVNWMLHKILSLANDVPKNVISAVGIMKLSNDSSASFFLIKNVKQFFSFVLHYMLETVVIIVGKMTLIARLTRQISETFVMMVAFDENSSKIVRQYAFGFGLTTFYRLFKAPENWRVQNSKMLFFPWTTRNRCLNSSFHLLLGRN